jgi:hypothetical protein
MERRKIFLRRPIKKVDWYHGGDLKFGTPKGRYLYVTDSSGLAEYHASEDMNGKVYRLRTEYHQLVADHPDGGGRKVILQDDLRENGGAMSVFEEVI